MSRWRSVKARRLLAALLRIGWEVAWQKGSHRRLKRAGWPNSRLHSMTTKKSTPGFSHRSARRPACNPKTYSTRRARHPGQEPVVSGVKVRGGDVTAALWGKECNSQDQGVPSWFDPKRDLSARASGSSGEALRPWLGPSQTAAESQALALRRPARIACPTPQ